MTPEERQRATERWANMSPEARAEWQRKHAEGIARFSVQPRKKPAVYFRGIRIP